MKWKRQPKDFVRPMLNSPVRESTADAELFIKRAVTRLDASREATKILVDWMCSQPSPVPRNDPPYMSRIRSLETWQSLHARHSPVFPF